MCMHQYKLVLIEDIFKQLRLLYPSELTRPLYYGDTFDQLYDLPNSQLESIQSVYNNMIHAKYCLILTEIDYNAL
jgi:hypothetical protein